ncbi:CCA tRNA nucleotidyltransferase [Flexibacterium corallicola]|uniref:CCA tRNA nucleotidyltransferase n=1 Tax=Flexibacterium corallicola TaxID=3037259 RepID=UPI00286EB634|nr:CCA tRNA nucleotidyltransferase [Pseudovibrio sp. M1P-2-3]
MTLLKNADWLHCAGLQGLFDVLEQDGDRARVVGGPVRNALLGEPVDDIDIACTALPLTTLERAKAAGLKVIPTGIDHGTLTIISDGHPYEVTSLREDVETHGRHATVYFGKDWVRDAQRRDFTMNALYVDREGELFDPLGGLEDCLGRRLRFIGDARTRIKEDYLRILRFFRFFGTYGEGVFDPQSLAACIAEKEGLASLSAERVTKEIWRLLPSPRAKDCLIEMHKSGILSCALGGDVELALFLSLERMGRKMPATKGAQVRLTSLIKGKPFPRLRLSNAQVKASRFALSLLDEFLQNGLDEAALKAALVNKPRSVVQDAVFLYWATILQDEFPLNWESTLAFVENWQIPDFPVSGGDLIALGFAPGPLIGEALAKVKQEWAANDYQSRHQELLNYARTLVSQRNGREGM